MRRTSHILPCVRSGTPGHKPCRYFRPVCPCSRRPPSSPIGSSSVRGVGYGEIRASARRSGPVNSHRVYVRPLMDLLQASAFFSSDRSHQPVELNVKSWRFFTGSGWGFFKISATMITTEFTAAEKHAWYISMAVERLFIGGQDFAGQDSPTILMAVLLVNGVVVRQTKPSTIRGLFGGCRRIMSHNQIVEKNGEGGLASMRYNTAYHVLHGRRITIRPNCWDPLAGQGHEN